ncbi:class I SAM-dependent methyltransferase [Desulforhopalus singaporensis]|uniref:Methyltransferase domain-containing protein n=1 Tax=Desulforhopalus singaporensis TaxID=91360 RepID=A0A1H0LFE5_9BACT|nr:class I SAM-dependent methyltransferase [Desulforhopalus singaporensis]SDO66884.1 Methyltransferase domain-containing protein [Desulforhopalus singaporensis]
MTSPELHCPSCGLKLCGHPDKTCRTCGYSLHYHQKALVNPSLTLPEGFSDVQKNHLLSIEKDHFWFSPRSHLLTTLAGKHTSVHKNALEIGCGTGRLLSRWELLYHDVTAVDAHPDLVAIAARNNQKATVVHADVTSLPFDDNVFDNILSFDVLEHVDDVSMLQEARRVAHKNSRLLLSAPAFQSLWSYADELAGHKRRYTRDSLNNILNESGWKLTGCNYYQCALFPLIWLSRRVVKERGRTLERHPSTAIAGILGLINSCEVVLSSRFSMPFGSSIIIWAEAR